jgi:hypothetical protein
MNVQIEESWKQHLAPEFEKDYFIRLTEFVRSEYQTATIYPPGRFIFNAFNLCPFDKVKVVIIGQDPYHGPGQAHGLCFSVNDGVPFPPSLQNIFKDYLEKRKFLGREAKPISLMDLATVCARYFHKTGRLENLVVSDEINACTIEIEAEFDGKKEPWYLLFKNETHNHPTEIEPFGGASTCLGGAIRDPLSGRAFVFQAMRLTGAADVLEPISETLPGKLPQRTISKQAANGYSSYGNQIGLATTHVSEIYDEGYKAKRMEVGFVAGAVPKSWVRREKPAVGDVVIVLGGATGRDGVGGATGSLMRSMRDCRSILCGRSSFRALPTRRRVLSTALSTRR